MNGEHRSLPVLVNLCLSACGRVVASNTHCRIWPGYMHVGYEKLCIIIAMLMVSSSRWGSFFNVVGQWHASESD